ncbi:MULTISPECIES: potassium channel family protein [unclassified Streptomyces]|uniref:potassium channel family protein n=1 Tax=unclassified Streptomyces TaxID=2593676 RepID=UPI0038127901
MPLQDERRLREWERRGSVPLSVASLVFLVTYAVRVLAHELPRDMRDLLLLLTLVTWAFFVADYLLRVTVAPHRWSYVRRRWLDLVVVIMPLLRPLRILQNYSTVQSRRERPRLTLEARVMSYAGLTTLLLGFAASLQVYAIERQAPGASIRTYGDAVWWACSAVTTTGYGDVVPVTAKGRLIGAGVMFLGVVLIGAVVASFASWLTQSFRRPEERRNGRRPPEDG